MLNLLLLGKEREVPSLVVRVYNLGPRGSIRCLTNCIIHSFPLIPLVIS